MAKQKDSTKTYGKIKKFLSTIFVDSYKVEIMTRLPKLKTWEEKQTGKFHKCSTRIELYEFLQKEYLKEKPIDYLEFGVFKGETINFWRKLNKNPNSRFVGFDTFTRVLPREADRYGHVVPGAQEGVT